MGRPSLWAVQGVRTLLQVLQKAMGRFKQRVSMTGVCALLQAWPLAPAAWEAGALAEPGVAAGPRGKGSSAARGCCAAAVTMVVESRGGAGDTP